MNKEAKNFEDFWQASSLNEFNLRLFAEQLNKFDSNEKQLLIEYPKQSINLAIPWSRLNKIAKQRKSERVFSDKQLSQKDMSLLLSSFYAWNGLEHRGYPSAGATYVTEIYGVCFNSGKYNGEVFYYDAEHHGINVIHKAPSWEEARINLNIDIQGIPSLLLLFVMFTDRALKKYGERGGRFALLEVGAAMQQLSLQVASLSRIKGFVVGGVMDEYWLKILKLQNQNAKIALGYLVGR